MNIIIPLGGKGERFSNAGHILPKPLIKVLDKEIICYVLDNLHYEPSDHIYIIYQHKLDEHDFNIFIKKHYPFITLIKLDGYTSGAAETLSLGIAQVMLHEHESRCMIIDCDIFYTTDIINLYRPSMDNAVFYCNNTDIIPIYSYISINDDNVIIDIKEKIKISDNANIGIYCFNNINILYEYAQWAVSVMKSECYISCIIAEMIKDNHIFKGIPLQNDTVYFLGTPKQVSSYIDYAHLFLFDLDGTLVITDEIYYTVWQTLLIKYNLILTPEIFKSFIQGNNDKTVICNLLPCITVDLDQLSIQKDELFLNNLDKILIIPGVIDMLIMIKSLGHKVSIVTNCNRKVAESILSLTKINLLIDNLIIANECPNSKPHPDPYLAAIQYYASNNTKCIIFEDSKTGLLSARSINPKCLVGIETLYSADILINHCGASITYKDYLNYNIDTLLKYVSTSTNICNIIDAMKPGYTAISVNIDNVKLKGGYISDVLSVEIITETEKLYCIMKLENNNESVLSKMAEKLGLYEREYYFYENISKYVNIKCPKFYGLIKDNNFMNTGIILENLNKRDFALALDLNNENITVSLKIIKECAKLHSKFWGKDLARIFPQLKKNDDPLFNPTWSNYLKTQWPIFENKWKNILSDRHLDRSHEIIENYSQVQNNLSNINLTLCHGDVKSGNLFYTETKSPYFIDWQYVAIGKGVQDIVFFMIESFTITTIKEWYNIFKEYYFIKLYEYGITNYTKEQYNTDWKNAVIYYPFFVAIWFGTTPEDDLIDKNFPLFFIQRLFNFIDLCDNNL